MSSTPNLEAFDDEDIVEYFRFLDDLRESGETNMWGAASYVQNEYWLSRNASRDITLAWMHTFSQEKTAEERAKEALATLDVPDTKEQL